AERRAARQPVELGAGEVSSTDFLLDPAPRLEPGEAAACRLWRFAPPQVRAEDLPPEEVARLKALGYLR
ncbi:MAG TPA: hypothetical protein VKF62_03550, partial [Planctomycetota bacterium]|nr:hypothetical protein [Planctomycetota bacterium]